MSMNLLDISLRRILIINVFGIGDVLFTTPMIRNLKIHFPQAYIGYLCNRRTAELLNGHPLIDEVLVYEGNGLGDICRRSRWQSNKKILAWIWKVRNKRFDVVLDLSLSGFMGFATWMAGIKYRIGFNYKKRGFFLTTKVNLEGYEDKHVMDYYLGLLEEVGLPIRQREMELFIKDEDHRWAEGFLNQSHMPMSKPIIGVVPGGGESWGKDAFYKRWPIEYFAKLADKFVEKFAAGIILMGGKNDEELCRHAAGLMRQRSLSACGKTSITQFAALARRCSLVVTNDGGPLHVAVAAGTKTVSIFGPVDERVYGPYSSHNHRVVKTDIACRPCYRRFRRASCDHISCLRRITVEDVMRKVEEIL